MDLASRLKDLTAPTGEEELLNIRYPHPRLRISPRHALIVLAGAALVCAGFLTTRPTEPTPQAAHIAALPTAASATPTATPESLVVSVVGAVAHPGLFTLPPDARAADALARAEPLPEADLLGINHAQKLTDGTQILVPTPGQQPPPGAAPDGAPGGVPGKISLNTATTADLVALPGIGAKTADAIINHRDRIGGFTSVEQLKDIKGIGAAKYADIEPHVTL